MEKAKISSGQLLVLIILFNMGTAIIRVLATQAANDAWLAILLGMLGGLLIFQVYIALYRFYPELPLTGYARAIAGQRVGWLMGVLYTLFFIHGAARDLREGADLLISSVLDLTPGTIVSSVMILSVGFVLIQGIEVLARTAQIFFTVLTISALVTIILIFLSGIVDIDRLLPFLGNGWKPVVDITLKQTIEFPYEELICFTMILPYLHHRQKGIRMGSAAVLLSGIILSCSSALNIAVLGADISGRATFPLLYTISLINLGEFVQRLDVVGVLTLIVGDFFKVAIFFYASVMAASDVFRIKDYRNIVLPVGLVILLSSFMLSGNFAEQIEEGDLLLLTIFLLFGVGIPVLLLAGAIVRKLSRYMRVSRR